MRFLSISLFLLWAGFAGRAQNSVLATGQWLKVGITQSGIYQITPSWLSSLGVKASSIGVYGHEIGELPQSNSAARPIDLQAIPFLKQGDKILFYGEKFNHHYSDTTFYFIRLDDPAPRAITDLPS
ncbi:MAG: hypothetical protein ACKOUQ_09275, partial [Aquirufa sp.]